MTKKSILAAVFLVLCVIIFSGWWWTRPSGKVPAPTEPMELKGVPSVSPVPSPSLSTSDFENGVVLSTYKKVAILDTAAITKAQYSFLKKNVPVPITTIAVYELHLEVPTATLSGVTSPIKAQVFIPVTHDKVPVIVYGSGTSGLAPACAPSLENVEKSNIGNYANQMISLASLGYLVIFPDYEGFFNPSTTHPYFVADLEAKVLLGSLRGTQVFADSEVTDIPTDFKNVFLMGYSQGGHAALAAAVNRQWLDDPSIIKGVIGYAPAFDVVALLADSPRLAPYLVYAYRKHYGIANQELESILLPRHISNLENDVLSHCIDTVYKFYPSHAHEIYTTHFWEQLVAQQLESITPSFAQALAKNQVNTWSTEVPVLIVQGSKDPIVTENTQRSNLRKFCRKGMRVTYHAQPHANHFQSPSQGTLRSHSWMQKILAGDIPDDCLSLPE
ncbi:MAG TPA: alpha/beta fold hydrolase [Vitreimonas sp.]|nr:alpha/beta fold hydrolase [Vitreimonas sp.]